jgi:hypothetical protein
MLDGRKTLDSSISRQAGHSARSRHSNRVGKGSPEYWVAVVKTGKILYEDEGRLPYAKVGHADCHIKCRSNTIFNEIGGKPFHQLTFWVNTLDDDDSLASAKLM